MNLKLVFIPEMILGNAALNVILLNICHWFAPKLIAALINTGLILLIPSRVYDSIGKNVTYAIIKNFGSSPIPNQMMNNGINA